MKAEISVSYLGGVVFVIILYRRNRWVLLVIVKELATKKRLPPIPIRNVMKVYGSYGQIDIQLATHY